MKISELIKIIEKKILSQDCITKVKIEDKSFLHKNHSGYQKGKFHLKVTISSVELKKLGRIERNKKVYKILDEELKNYIHSLQILID